METDGRVNFFTVRREIAQQLEQLLSASVAISMSQCDLSSAMKERVVATHDGCDTVRSR